MDFQEYELLLDLAETKNITRTAERLGYSQPGASHILKKIEEELGFPVIFRKIWSYTDSGSRIVTSHHAGIDEDTRKTGTNDL